MNKLKIKDLYKIDKLVLDMFSTEDKTTAINNYSILLKSRLNEFSFFKICFITILSFASVFLSFIILTNISLFWKLTALLPLLFSMCVGVYVYMRKPNMLIFYNKISALILMNVLIILLMSLIVDGITLRSFLLGYGINLGICLVAFVLGCFKLDERLLYHIVCLDKTHDRYRIACKVIGVCCGLLWICFQPLTLTIGLSYLLLFLTAYVLSYDMYFYLNRNQLVGRED